MLLRHLFSLRDQLLLAEAGDVKFTDFPLYKRNVMLSALESQFSSDQVRTLTLFRACQRHLPRQLA